MSYYYYKLEVIVRIIIVVSNINQKNILRLYTDWHVGREGGGKEIIKSKNFLHSLKHVVLVSADNCLLTVSKRENIFILEKVEVSVSSQ